MLPSLLRDNNELIPVFRCQVGQFLALMLCKFRIFMEQFMKLFSTFLSNVKNIKRKWSDNQL